MIKDWFKQNIGRLCFTGMTIGACGINLVVAYYLFDRFPMLAYIQMGSSGLMIFFNVIVYINEKYLTKKLSIESDLYLQRLRIAQIESSNQQKVRNMKELYKINHDLRHHMLAVNMLIDNDKRQEAIQLCDDILGHINLIEERHSL